MQVYPGKNHFSAEGRVLTRRMETPFSRKEFLSGEYKTLSRGRWANADLYLYRHGQIDWVIKDFSACPFLVRRTWGRLMVKREYAALSRLNGIPGIPGDPFLLDEDAVCYRYTPGKTLRKTPAEFISDSYFYRLEALVKMMHARHIVHLDIRNRGNILVGWNGEPVLLDFQSSLDLDRVPRFLHKLLKEIDLSGVYKSWQSKQPESLDSARTARLCAMEKKRFLWIFKGYPLGTRRDRRS